MFTDPIHLAAQSVNRKVNGLATFLILAAGCEYIPIMADNAVQFPFEAP